MKKQLQSFLEFLRFNRNVSRNTVLAYRIDLTQFIAFLEDRIGRRRIGQADLTHQNVRAFLGELYRRGSARASSRAEARGYPLVHALLVSRGLPRSRSGVACLDTKAGEEDPATPRP